MSKMEAVEFYNPNINCSRVIVNLIWGKCSLGIDVTAHCLLGKTLTCFKNFPIGNASDLSLTSFTSYMMKSQEDETSGCKGKKGGGLDLSRAATVLLLLTGEEATSGTEGTQSTDALSPN